MNPKIEKLRAEEERNEQELERLRHQEQRLRNRISYYESGARQTRAHRLITRGAALESIWPEVRPLPERDFYALMERILTLPASQSVLQSVLKSRADVP